MSSQKDIAIIGYAYRLPGDVDNDSKLWEFYENRNALRVDIVECGRYDKGQVPWEHPNPFKHASQWEGCFNRKVEDLFDPQFFHMNKNDAIMVDTPQKMALLTSAEALECAGIDFAKINGTNAGVFAGVQLGPSSRFVPTFGWDEYCATSSSLAMVANRISFYLNLTGPSVGYATACSAFMSAAYGAVSSLSAGDCRIGILVAATVHMGHAHNPSFAQLGVLSPDGRCRSFDDDANGYVPADGAFCYVLKLLENAEADNDKIFGVIKGCGISAAGPDVEHVGLAPGRSLTTPTPDGQMQALLAAYQKANIPVDDVSYIECHATGTKVGDKIEAEALGRVFGTATRSKPLLLGSSRSNFGHMEAASGGLSLLKTLLMFQHRVFLPLSSNFQKPNKNIPFGEWKLLPLDHCVPFPAASEGAKPVTVGINSFGFGGSNGHLVVQEYIPSRATKQGSIYSQPRVLSPSKYHLVVLSAKSTKGLYEMARNLAHYIETSVLPAGGDDQHTLYHIAGNLAVRKTHYSTARKFFAVNSVNDLLSTLHTFASMATRAAADIPKEMAIVSVNELQKPRICFIFPGQGAQWVGCGAVLYKEEPVFKAAIDKVDEYYSSFSGISLRDIMLNSKSQEHWDRCDVAQPVTFMIQVGMTELFRSMGVHPTCIIGHSAGEMAAVYASGAVSLKDMVHVVYERSRLQQEISGAGRLLVVPLSSMALMKEVAKDPKRWQDIEISVYNSHTTTVVSASQAVCDDFAAHLKETHNVTCQFVRGSVPFHSKYMEKIREGMLTQLAFLDREGVVQRPVVPVISTVKAALEASFDKYYWWINTRFAVKFEQAIVQVLTEFQPTAFVELSPHITLRSHVRDIYGNVGQKVPSYVVTLIRQENDSRCYTAALGNLFEHGADFDFNGHFPNPKRITLPYYPFDKVDCHADDNDAPYYKRHGPFGAGPLLGKCLWGVNKNFEVIVSSRHFPNLKQHVVHSTALMPAAGYLEMVLEATGGVPVVVTNVQFQAACPITDQPRVLQLSMGVPENLYDAVEWKIASSTDKYDTTLPWTIHCTGLVRRRDPKEPVDHEQNVVGRPEKFSRWLYGQKEFYQRIPKETFYYGPDFQTIKEFYEDDKSMSSWIQLRLEPEHFQQTKKAGWNLHPYMLDGVLQSYIGTVTRAGRVGIPYFLEKFEYFGAPTSPNVHLVINSPPGWNGCPEIGVPNYGDALVYDENGTLLCVMTNYHGLLNPQRSLSKTNVVQKWQPKALALSQPVSHLKFEEGWLSAAKAAVSAPHALLQPVLTKILREYLLNLGVKAENADLAEILKIIEKKTSPHLDYIKFLAGAVAGTTNGVNKDHHQQGEVLNDFLGELAVKLQEAPATSLITPEWVFSPFRGFLKEVLTSVVTSSPSRVVRILEVCNNSKFSVLPALQALSAREFSFVEYFVASASEDILGNIVDEASVNIDFPIRSLLYDCEKGIPDGAVGYAGFFDAILVNTPVTPLTAEILHSYRKYLTPGGVLAITGFTAVADWLRCFAVDAKAALPSKDAVTTLAKETKFASVEIVQAHEAPYATLLLQADSTVAAAAADKAEGKLVVFADASGFYDGAAHDFAGHYTDVTIVERSSTNWKQLLNDLLTSHKAFDILFAWSVDDKTDFAQQSFVNLTDIARIFVNHESSGKVGLWVLSHNAASDSANFHTGPLWGLLRSIAQELADMNNIWLGIVDVGAKEDMKAVASLVASKYRENEVMVRNGALQVLRMVPVICPVKDLSVNDTIIQVTPGTNTQVGSKEPVALRLERDASAQLSAIFYHTFDLPETLLDDQVVVEVHYAALNFRDLMVGQDRLAWQSYEKSFLGKNLGLECSGVVIRVAPNVTAFKAGDKVMCTYGGSIANYAVVHQRTCFHLPSNVSLIEGSSLLSVYLTAWYALVHMARLTPDQSCLVHSAMGGVGLATIGIAKHIGFKVYGTAGSDSKRKSLIDMGCAGVYDSHSLLWAKQLLHDTNGKGVDVVFNSLYGAHIELGIEVLAEGGWFCEIGKRDIYQNSKIGMYNLRKNTTITAVDTDRLLVTHPLVCRHLSESILKLIEEGKLPTLPVEEFAANNYLAALRHMQQGKHVGKIVLNMRSTTNNVPLSVVDHRPLFKHNATYLVTGALGGYGLRLLPFMYQNGARHLLLTDQDYSRKRTVAWLKTAAQLPADANVVIVAAKSDVYDDVVRALASVGEHKLPPIKGVFHLAGVLQDGNLMSQDAAAYEKVLGPKALGALNLHRATLNTPLDYFVLTSSVASAIGSSGQANYAAANSFLDALARYRRANGLPASTFNMGALLDAGMAVKDLITLNALKAKGIIPMPASAALSGLDYQLRNNLTEMISAELTWNLRFDAKWGYCTSGLLSTAKQSEGSITISYGSVIASISRQIQKLTGVTEVPIGLPLSSFGIDSMMGAELSMWLKDKFGVVLSAVKLMTSTTCQSITELILSQNAKSTSASSSAAAATSKPIIFQSTIAPKPLEIVSPQFFTEMEVKSEASPATAPVPDAHANGHAAEPHANGTAVHLNGKDHHHDDEVKEKHEWVPSAGVQFVMKDVEDIATGFEKVVGAANNGTGIASLTAPKETKNVFITGAAGFVGRVFLARVLRDAPHLNVYCIIRASSEEAGVKRLHKAMEEAGYWQNSFAGKFHVLCGDLSGARMGLSEAAYEEMSGKIDTVYHFAASTSLIDNYATIRKDNTLVMLNLMEFCINKRAKIFHHISTLAVFPQYVSGFPHSDRKMLYEDTNIDLEKMEAMIPPTALGYAWSKWACEQIVLKCSAVGKFPAVMYRIPWTSATADTGYTSEISSVIAIAAMQEGIVPFSSLVTTNTAIDTCCDVILKLSLSPRKHNIYHINNNAVTHYRTMVRWMNESGYEVKQIENEQLFFDTGKKESSPLRKILPLLELMREPWYKYKRPEDDPIYDLGLPVSTAHVDEDYGRVKWPDMELLTAKSWLWIIMQGDKWPYPLPNVNMDTANILQHVQSCQGMSFMGPSSFYEPYQRLLTALDNESNLTNLGRVIAKRDIWRSLSNRLHLYNMISTNPSILQQKINKPVIILGLNRTGTTLLHRLMALDGRFRAPLFYEMLWPIDVWTNNKNIGSNRTDVAPRTFKNDDEILEYVNSQEADPRLRRAHFERESRKLVSDETNIHVAEAYLPEEDFSILRHDFQCLSWTASNDIPSFRNWLTTKANLTSTYAFHKQFLQVLQAQGRPVLSPGHATYRWLLKFPMHMMFLKYIFETYPDVTIIQTHRDPAEVVASWCSLVSLVREPSSTHFDIKRLGQQQLTDMTEMLDSAQMFRKTHPELKDRFIDVRYKDLVSAPLESMKDIYRKLGMDYSDDVHTKFLSYLQNQKRGPTHKYELATYGLEPKQVKDAFQSYIQEYGL